MSTATIRDVAKIAGVGIGTVSRVLNDSPDVSERTRLKVLSAIEALDYTPNPIARRLSLGKTLTVGVIAPFFTRPSVVERLRGIENVLGASEYDLIVFNVETVARRDAYFRDVPRRERVDGLLIISLLPDEEDVQRLRRAQMPVVLVDISHPAFSRVSIDDVAGGRLAAEHLLALGHRRIGFVSDYEDPSFDFTANNRRLQGFRTALEAAGIAWDYRYHAAGRHSLASAREMAHRLMQLPAPPTAIFAASDTLAFGVLEAVQEMGLTVPDEVSVIGYDDIEVAEYLQLTTIRQSLFESGVKGGRLLLREIRLPPSTPEEILLPTELVVRETTAPPARSERTIRR